MNRKWKRVIARLVLFAFLGTQTGITTVNAQELQTERVEEAAVESEGEEVEVQVEDETLPVQNEASEVEHEESLSSVQTPDMNADRLQTITTMDENGNIKVVEAEDGTVAEEWNPYARSFSGQIVNFNTKGAVVTEYKEVSTGAAGYTCGAYGADAAYLGTNSGKVRFMLSGVIGEVNASEVQIVDVSKVNSLSYYTVSSGRVIHRITTNVNGSGSNSSLDLGPAPDYLSEGVSYYSYDGHYFYNYSSFSYMLSDYNNGTRSHSVNPDKPFYNYYQFLPLRSKTNYTASQIDTYLNNKTASTSKMRNTGSDFVSKQDTYGVNALVMMGIAGNESAWGTSTISKTKNNLFGLNAVDASPSASANTFSSVSQCIKDFAETYMSKRYLRPGYTYHSGGYLGNKGSGINVSYASDPYWGEKAASLVWNMDKTSGNKDYNKYIIGVKDLLANQHTVVNVRNASNNSGTVLYKTPNKSGYAMLILDNGMKSNGYYKVQSEGVLNSAKNAINTNSGVYDFKNDIAYVSEEYLTTVTEGGNGGWNIVNPVSVPSSLSDSLIGQADTLQLGELVEATNGKQVGTTGIGESIDRIRFQIKGISDLGITYSVYTSANGWSQAASDGAYAGTDGTAIEAVKLELTGAASSEYELYYRAHVGKIGWQAYSKEGIVAGTTDTGNPVEALQVVLLKKIKDIEVSDKAILEYQTSGESFGWSSKSANGEQSGTIGMSEAIEGLKIQSNISGLGVEYSTHIPNIGWQSYVADGTVSEVTTSPKRIEAIKVRLTGTKASEYDIYYRVHAQNLGWMDWVKNDEIAGTSGLSYRLEALQIVLCKKDEIVAGVNDKAPEVVYSSYVNGQGWQSQVSNGESSGTTGKSLALGALKVNLVNSRYDGSVEYEGHIQNIGWDQAAVDGQICGTTKNLRLEAIKIRLKGEIADHYDIYYRSHVQNYGWLGWAKNGEPSGSEAYSYRVEAMEIQLVKKGTEVTLDTANAYKIKPASVQYSSHVQTIGWQSFVADGATSGTSGKSLRLEAMKIRLAQQKYAGGIEYASHVQNIGWQSFVSDGEITGTSGKGYRLEAIKINLTGEIKEHCDIYYRVHIQSYGWLNWAKNGEPSGSQGLSKRIEAIEIKLLPKEEKAPSGTGKAFVQ